MVRTMIILTWIPPSIGTLVFWVSVLLLYYFLVYDPPEWLKWFYRITWEVVSVLLQTLAGGAIVIGFIAVLAYFFEF